MCIVCSSWKNNKLTIGEAYNNLLEMKNSISEKHFDDVVAMLNEYDDNKTELNEYDNVDDFEEDLDWMNEIADLDFIEEDSKYD